MKGYMEEWIGRGDMPKEISSWFSKDEKAYHIIMRNKKGGPIQGTDILHLKFREKQAQSLLNKYHNLYPKIPKN